MDELEVKARVDDPAALRVALARAGAVSVFRGRMLDRRYDRGGEFERRDEVIRFRVYQPEQGTAWGVLGWKGPVGTRGSYRHREEIEAHVSDPGPVPDLLAHLGLTVSLRIDRDVEQWELGGAVLRLERYPEMDVLIEVEGEPAAIERAVAATGLPRDAFLPESLPHFVADWERRQGRRARLADA